MNLERVIDCPFSLAVDFADEIFPELDGATTGVRVGVFTHRVRVTFKRQTDSTEMGRAHDEIAFDWDAGSRFLPNFHGVLRFRAESSQTRVSLAGEYVPPLRAFGNVFERTIGYRLARATGHDLLARLAKALESRWAAEQRLPVPAG